MYIRGEDGFYSSEDGGGTWNKFTTNPQLDTASADDTFFSFITNNKGILYIAAVLDSVKGGVVIYKQVVGKPWSRVAQIKTAYGYSSPMFDSAGNLYFMGEEKVTINGKITGRGKIYKLTPANKLEKHDILAFAANQLVINKEGILFLVDYKNGVSKSTDHGVHWQLANRGLLEDPNSEGSISADVILALDDQGNIYASRTLHSNNYNRGIFKLTYDAKKGEQWVPIGNVNELPTNTTNRWIKYLAVDSDNYLWALLGEFSYGHSNSVDLYKMSLSSTP